jgi:hypothetical protein
MLLSFLEVVAGFAAAWSQVSGLHPNPLSDAYPLSFSPVPVLNQTEERHWLPPALCRATFLPGGLKRPVRQAMLPDKRPQV